MKKLLLLFLLSLTFGVGQIFAQDVFFSEYVEGSGNNKAIEIYNGTGATIDMSDYTIEKHNSAGVASSATYTPGAVMVAAGDVYVLANSSAVGITSDETTNSQVMTYNGDDAVVLKKAGVIIDIIGTIDGNDPGSEWGSGVISTQNNTIRRLATITAGDVDGFTGAGTTSPGDISSEWEGFAQNEFTGLGSHTAGPATVTFVINEVDADTPGTDMAEFIEIFDGGVGNSPLDGYSIVLFNGSDNLSYNDAFDLDGLRTDANGYFLLAGQNVAGIAARVTTGTGVQLVDNSVQNGADAVALYQDDAINFPNDTPITTGSTLIDALVYDTDDSDDADLLTLLNPGQPQINERENGNGDTESSQRIPNGSGGLRNTNTYSVLTPTPGAENLAPVIPSVAPSELLLSEVVLTPAEEEYLEIYNPTTGTIVLTDVYITDATHAGSGNFYYNLPTGADFGGGGFTDFHARFPNGSSIAPGEYQTVALNGAADFIAAYGQDPTYELYETAPNAIPDMVEAAAGSINYPANEGGLADGGEIVSMYYWDGATDLVTDLDYIMWGDDSEAVDKTGISIDGPDADGAASAYLNDTGTGAQDLISNAVHAAGKSFQRIDDTEGTETFVGGNGAGGHNETSENLSVTWFGGASPTPNGPYVPFIINEIDAVVTAPENSEFIEIFDRGVGGNQSLNGYIVVLFDGATDLSYQTYDLAGLQTDANGYFLIGGANVTGIDARVGANTGLKVASADWLQNGADAVAIYRDVVATFPNGTAITKQNLMDALVYDTDDADDAGLLALLNAGQAQINENQNGDAENHSMQRIANGTGGPLNTSTYKMSAPTDGAVNFAILPPSAAPTKLLLSEIILTPENAEYIEIFNPTTASIDLTDVYLTDATFTPNGVFYSKLPSGTDAGGGGFSDFNARFPNGSTIAAGEYQTVALNGANDFFTVHGQNATYELYEVGANPVPDMLEATAGSINGQGGLSSGEVAILYYWDGATDLVSDLDYAVWGDKNEAVDKTGQTVDGPDGGTAGSTYLADTDVATQAVISANSHVDGKSYQRIDNNEGTETLVGGNGVQGHDETSENLPVTWFDGGNPTPNAGFIPFVINEVDADTPGSDTAEFIEIFDGGIGNFSLDGYSIVLFNGNGDISYNAFDLDGMSTDANGYFVLGSAAVPNVDMVVANNFLQNGADAVALYKDDAANFPNGTALATGANLVDAFVYDTDDADDAGLLTLLNGGQAQINENGQGNKDLHSSQRIPNGSGGLRNTSTYTQIVPTPGEMNFAITTIAAARAMADGTLGVTIEGNLTSADELGTTAYIQDATGGIALYNGGGFNWGVYAIGDKLRVTGDRASFNDQIQMTNLTIIDLNTSTILSPLVIDLTQMDAHRGELVQIDGLHFPAPGDPLWGNSNLTLTSGADNGIMRVSSSVTDLTNKAQPAICDVIGIMGNYQNTSQLLPRMGADLPCANALTVSSGSFSPQTLDVVSWNIEHFADAGVGPADDDLQVTKARDVILALDADIYALEEISNDAKFIADLLPQLPGYAFELSPYTSNGSVQNLAFLYKTSVVTKLSTRGINVGGIAAGDVTDANFPTGNKDQHWASGRFPYMMTTDVNVNGSKERVNFIVIHGKAFNDNIAFQRREFDATALHDSLSNYMPNEKIIILGDYNDDLDVSISLPDPSPYAIFDNDVNNYKVVTKSLSLQGKRSTVSFDNMIDHITMTNELFSAHMAGSENVHYEFYANDPTYDATTSDHHPISARFAFPEISINSGTAVTIVNNGNATVGSTTQGTDITQTFTINNEGLSDLVISSLTIAGTDLTISAGIAPNTTVLAGQTVTFDVEMNAATVGIKSATVIVTSNDGDESTYTINLTGEVKAPVNAGGGGGVITPNEDFTINPPTGLIATPITTTYVSLTWTDNSDNENGYYVYQNSIIIAIIPPNSTSFEVYGLTANTFYNFNVAAFNGVSLGRSNTANTATLPLDPTVSQSVGVCGTSGVAYIRLGNTPERGSYRWYADSTGGTPIAEVTDGYFETPVLTQNTTFYATAVSSHGLESNPRIAVTAYVYQDVEAEVLEGTSVKSCDAQVTLHALEQDGATYQWRVNGALSANEGIEFEATVSGRYQLIVTRNSCSDTYGFDVVTDYKPTAIINDARTTADFCQSGSLLAANTDENSVDATYEWLLNGNVVGTGTSAVVSESGTYILRVMDNTCVNEAKIGVTVFDLPQNQVITASATDFCAGDEVTLSVPAMTGVNYRWFKNGVTIGGANSNTYVASVEAGYSVEMFIDNLNCSVISQSIAISNFVSPEVELTRDDKTINLDIPIAHQSVEWFTTGGIPLPQYANQTSISPDFGEYWAVITYPTGCSINSNSIRFFEENPNGGGVIDGLDDDEAEGDTFEVFPNPSNDGIFHVRLSTSLTSDTQLSLTDALGRDLNMNVVIPQGATTLNLDLSEFADGMYYLQFISSEGTLTRKIIKQ